ncbi:MAG: hypothetical protein QOG09_188 [Solirubrobacterales bacterium]|nr:hypothetical protein [Solirubrobacterales bacterium]
MDLALGWTTKRVGFLLAGLLATAAALAPAARASSGNDNLASATVQTGSSWADFGNDGSYSAEPGEDSHDGVTASRSLWEKWTAPANAKVTVETCFTNTYDNVLEVYSGPVSSPTFAGLNSLAEDDDGCGGTSKNAKLTFFATAGTTYYIALDHKSGGEINWYMTLNTAPANDDFSGAVLTGAPVSVQGTTDHASKQPNEPNHAGQPGGASVWYSWTAPTTGNYLVQTCAASFDSVLAVYEPGAGGIFAGGISLVVSADDGCGAPAGGSRATLAATQGTTYFIAIDGGPDLGQAAQGGFRLDVAAAPANDDLANAAGLTAFPLSPATVLSAGGNQTAATKEATEPNHAGQPGGQSIWYRWVAPVGGPVTVDTCAGSSSVDTLLAVYPDGAYPLAPAIGQNDNSCGQLSRVRFTATQGTAYLIAVDAAGVGGPIALAIHDVTAPDTAIGKVKVNAAKRKASVSFSGSDDRSDGIAFRCKLDRKAYAPCTSRRVYKRLKRGKHRVSVQAVDAAGNADAAPATKSFQI